MASRTGHAPAQWTADIAFNRDGRGDRWWSDLPATRGVYAFLDEGGACLCLATSANVRRMVRSRLEDRPDGEAPNRRVDYARLTKRVVAIPAGSEFETDWEYLQRARVLLPRSYATLFDRWSAWFVCCDGSAAHPRWTKQRIPGPDAAPQTCFGPLPDKHAAQRYIEMLEDAFDLCRYHHILVQAPAGAACAYKEMGRCPAPCDGSVSMDSYRAQINDSMTFAARGFEAWSEGGYEAMKTASARHEFESAQRLHERHTRVSDAWQSAFEHVRPLESLRWVSLQDSGTRGAARVFGIVGGTVVRMFDVALDEGSAAVTERLMEARSATLKLEPDLSRCGMENLAMVCDRVMHISSRKTARPSRGRFVAVDETAKCGDALRHAARAHISELRRPESSAADESAPLERGIELETG